MNEGAPIQDSSIPAPTPEAHRDSFGIQNFYSPDTLFALLAKDYKPHTNDLQNNWNAVAVSTYEPIASMDAHIISSLKDEDDKNVKDRFKKNYCFYGWINTNQNIFNLLKLEGSKKLLTPGFEPPEDIIPFLSKDVAVKRIAYLDLKEELIQSGINPNEISNIYTKEKDSRLAFEGEGFYLSFSFEKNGIYLQTANSLAEFDDFKKKQEIFFANFEKIIRVVYKIQGKTLPPVKLEFKPQTESPQEFLAKCSYCFGNYSTAESLKCPGCGACSPNFLILNKK